MNEEFQMARVMRDLRLFLAVGLLFAGVLAAAQTTSTNVTSAAAYPVKTYHDGGIRDLDAIGSRKVGCGRGLGNWYSIERQIAMGRDYAQQVETTSKLVTDPVVTEYINRLGQNLVRNSDSQVPFTIKVVDAEAINAFALPGGFFLVDEVMTLPAANEPKLYGDVWH